jgi:DNA replication ATP-dependent helicase Dna2
MLHRLLEFVEDEQQAGQRRLLEIWDRRLDNKLATGWTQRFTHIERGDESGTLRAWLDEGDNESRFREGDMLVLHTGRPVEDMLARGLVLESEEDECWLLRGASRKIAQVLHDGERGLCFADGDAIDLSGHQRQAIEEIAVSRIGREIVLPLLSGELKLTFRPKDVEHGEQVARGRGFNAKQAEAVGLAYGADRLACIQGPPGTGKSAVLALIARLLVERGERVLMTSHTHMAINNALNKIGAEGVAAVKIGRAAQCKGLDDGMVRHERLSDWDDRPDGGYVTGATPYATCTSRLAGCEFDTVLFDEASQVTVPLALMAMRKGMRYVFVGDHRQLPPVMLSRSVLDKDSMSAFAALTAIGQDHVVMLEETYRMNQWLAGWPSRMYYGGRLHSAHANSGRRLRLRGVPGPLRVALDPDVPAVFIPTADPTARTRNVRDATLVAELCAAAVEGGIAPSDIGIVTPYRAQGRAVRQQLRRLLGPASAQQVVADTVERMQGQERELVILSLATGDEVFLAAVAEFFFQPQRLNVSITRARSKLIVIGPDASRLPQHEEQAVRGWIAEYADLASSMKRVEL